MELACTHCGKRLQLADDKVPASTFAVTCPGCRQKFEVDPTAGAAEETPDRGSPGEPVESPGDAFAELPPHRPQDEELLSTVAPVAFVVRLGPEGGDGIADGLRRLGMHDVLELDDLEEAVETLVETDAGIVVVVMDKAPPPPCEPLRPLEALPFSVRRRTFVALVAGNVTTLDGMVAFLLQVNCLINRSDLGQLPVLLRRAHLHHLRLYRHWAIETD